MTRWILAAFGCAWLNALSPAQPFAEPPAHDWGPVRVTPDRTPAVEFQFVPGNREIAFYGYSKTVYLYDIASEKVRREVRCDVSVNDLSYSPDGKLMATAEAANGLRLRDAGTGRAVSTLKPAAGFSAVSSHFVSDDQVAALCYAGGLSGTTVPRREQLALWNVANGKSLGWPPTSPPESGNSRTRSRFVSGGNLLSVENLSYVAYVIGVRATVTDARSDKTSPVVQLSLADTVLDASPDGRVLLVNNSNVPPRLVDVATGQCVRVLYPGLRQAVTCAAFSPDGKLVATATGSDFLGVRYTPTRSFAPRDANHEIILWDVATGRRVAVCREPVPGSGYTNLKFSPDGKLIAASAGRADQPDGGPERRGDKLVLWGKVSTGTPGGDPATRFRDQGDTVQDVQTGLIWQKDGSASGRVDYYGAIRYATGLELGGQAGWRLPTPEELAGIYPATAKPFINTKYDAERPKRGERADYWTSAIDAAKPDTAMVYPWTPGGKPTSTSASQTMSFARCVHDPVKK